MNRWYVARIAGPLVMMAAAWHHWIVVVAIASFLWIMSCLPYEDYEEAEGEDE